MAMAICSSSKHSPSFPNIPFSITPYLRASTLHTLPSPTYTCVTLQEAAFTIPSYTDVEMEHNWCNKPTITRKRRRRRRTRGMKERSNDEEDDDDDDDDRVAIVDNKPRKSRFMTPKQEATFSWYLKERARIEGVRRDSLAETGGNDFSSSEWAKAAGISQHKLDKILWNGRESEKKLISCYHGLVLSIASSYQGKGLSIQDLTQEGSIGLLRGAVKFNPERGYKLSTYAYWWIRQSITRAIAKKSKIIRLPGSINELMPKICEANNALSRRLRRHPTYEEIAEAIGANPSSVRLAIERNRYPVSLDQAMTTRGCISLQDIIPGPEEMTPEAMVRKDMLKPKIRELLEPLCEREADILRLHYGLNGETPRSFEEIGRLVHLSRERVRQINSAALSKLRKMSKVDDLKYFI